jgi:hypothetical protein
MKIKISKSQWEEMGKKAGWMKKASLAVLSPDGEIIETLNINPKRKNIPTHASIAKVNVEKQRKRIDAEIALAKEDFEKGYKTQEKLNETIDRAKKKSWNII